MAIIYGPLEPPVWSPNGKGIYDQEYAGAIDAGNVVCFYCGEHVDFPALMWGGYMANIFLHPDCFQLLTVRLMRDLHEVQCMPTDGQP